MTVELLAEVSLLRDKVKKYEEVWEKVREELKRQIDHNLEVKEKFLVGSYTRIECQVTCTVLADVINIIDKHLSEVENADSD